MWNPRQGTHWHFQSKQSSNILKLLLLLGYFHCLTETFCRYQHWSALFDLEQAVARLLWKLEMALTSPKSLAGDLTQREESILHEGNCCHFLSANILSVGEWKVPFFNLIVWCWKCTLFFFSKFTFIVLIFHMGQLVFLKFEGTVLVYSSFSFFCVVGIVTRVWVKCTKKSPKQPLPCTLRITLNQSFFCPCLCSLWDFRCVNRPSCAGFVKLVKKCRWLSWDETVKRLQLFSLILSSASGKCFLKLMRLGFTVPQVVALCHGVVWTELGDAELKE